MRLAILGTRSIPAHYGGFEAFAEEIAHRLVNQSVIVSLIQSRRSMMKSLKHITLRRILFLKVSF